MNPERENIYRGLSQAAWGYFFLHIDFNLGSVSIFPRFMGFLLFPSAIGKLSGERRDLVLLRPLAAMLGVWSALDWLLSWFGGNVSGHILFLDLFMSAASLYFHFQFLTDMAAIAERYQPEGDNLDKRLRRRRTVYIVLITALDLVQDLPAGLAGPIGDIQVGLMTTGAVAAISTALFIMAGLFELRRCFREIETA